MDNVLSVANTETLSLTAACPFPDEGFQETLVDVSFVRTTSSYVIGSCRCLDALIHSINGSCKPNVNNAKCDVTRIFIRQITPNY